MKNKFENIFWDVGKVLFSEAEISNKEFKPVRKLLGISSIKSDEIFRKFWLSGMREGKIDEDNYWKEIIKVSEFKPKLEKVKRVYRESILPNSQLLDLVEKLSSKYNQYILSNHGKEWMKYLASNWELKKWFEEIYCSAWEGIGKPDRRFYKVVLQKSQIEPSRTIYIDDNKKNISVASSFGIRGIVYKDNKGLLKELGRIGIL